MGHARVELVGRQLVQDRRRLRYIQACCSPFVACVVSRRVGAFCFTGLDEYTERDKIARTRTICGGVSAKAACVVAWL